MAPSRIDPAAQFEAAYLMSGTLLAYHPFGDGHIHDTYLATVRQNGREQRFVHQKLNQQVFRDPEAVMSNMRRVTSHMGQKRAKLPAGERAWEALTIVPDLGGRSHQHDADGTVWRTFAYVEDSFSCEDTLTEAQAYEVGAAFGSFQGAIDDLSGPRLQETIPGFHNTPGRFQALYEAVAVDVCGRVRLAGPEIRFAQANAHLAPILIDLHRQGAIPERITHNDTKANNVLLSPTTGRWRCVVDLDTVMPGLAPYDFGDMVRSGAATSSEDARAFSTAGIDLARFRSLAEGYLRGTGSLLNDAEKAHLVSACQIITLETGVRFLTDYLRGDVYFKTLRPRHNLDRCRVQWKMVAAMQAKAAQMDAIIEALA